MLSNQRVAIFGAGAMGIVLASYIKQRGLNTDLFGRFAESTANENQRVVHFHGDNTVNLNVETSPPKSQSVDIAIIAVKAFDVLNTLNQIKPYMAVGSHIILTHNGMGTIQYLNDASENSFGYFCSLNSGATKQGSHVYPKGSGPSFCQLVSSPTLLDGHSNEHYHPLTAEELACLIPNSQLTENLEQILWEKLAVNCVINPITAIHKINNGEVLAPKYKDLIEQLLIEISQVAKCEGISLKPKQLMQILTTVATNTSENQSSMLQDVKAGRPNEIDFISGYVIKKAQDHQVSVPANQHVYDQLQQVSFTSAK